MKNLIVLTRCAIVSALLFLFAFGNLLHAQNDPEPRFISITKLKVSDWSDLNDLENELVKPYIQERIKQGNLQGHALYSVHYPNGDNEAYNYVWIDFFTDFNDLHLEYEEFAKIAYGAFPNADIPVMMDRLESVVGDGGNEVFAVLDESYPGPVGASDKAPRFLVANHMKVSEMNSSAYVTAEREIFKPMHQKRAKDGNMHDWLLCQRMLPYGSEWDNNFITLDVFNSWGQMGNGGGFQANFKAVHPGKDFEKTMANMLNLREVRRSEVWKLVSWVGSPTPEITYTTVKEGAGRSPRPGEEVSWRGEIMTPDGEMLFSTQSLGFDFHGIVGENIYDRFFDKALMQMKKGGIMKMNMPADMQDKQTKSITGGKDAIVKVELVEISMPKPNGAKLLAEIVEEQGLEAAKAKYKAIMANNPDGYHFRESDMNAVGYQLMGDGHNEAAVYVFKLNQKNNPKSWNACDSLADGYAAMGNYAEAKHCYEMALKIKPDFEAAKKKLEKL